MSLHKLRMKVVDDAKLSEADRRNILADNAIRLFHLEQQVKDYQRPAQTAAE
jgi:predicted TIM-barrel fold metal-dependent hydrolase